MRSPWRWFREPEVIGAPECPILLRWTVLNLGPRIGKLMVHRFLPNADDRDVHDHPRDFVTFVLRGGYSDMKPCDSCGATGRANWAPNEMRGMRGWEPPACTDCKGETVVLNERMTPGTIRLRPAHHRHRTMVDPAGCWTIVVMGPLRREWGFWVKGKWIEFREYGRRFGFGMRCD